MSQGSSISSLSPTAAKPDDADRHELAEIDRSTRLPVLVFFGSAIAWLLVGSLLALITAIQINFPSFLDCFGITNFGRLRPASVNAIVYGWASAAGIGVGIWLMARLCRVVLQYQTMLVVAALFWNLGNFIGLFSILGGYSTSIELLEYPSFASIFLFIAYAFIAIWGIVLFRFRKRGQVYVSQWYLVGAFLWFPWLYATANMLLVWHPIQGSAQGPVNFWYVQNLVGLWFVPLGLASIYYMIPKIIGHAIRSYQLSILAFWSLALLYNWSGMRYLIGGPIPAWMTSVSVVASILLFIPVILVGINHHGTMSGHYSALQWSPTLRFTVFGAAAFTLLGLQTGVMALPGFNQVIQFTDWNTGHFYLGIYAFFTMTIFGAMYYIIPRLTGWEWPCSSLIRWHFWLTAIGITMVVLCLSFGGLIQGFALGDDKVNFVTSIKLVSPFRLTAAFCGIFIVFAHLLFAANFVLMLLKLGTQRDETMAELPKGAIRL
ncbi:MAG: cbb3-type cytochrome c oxidase subunit I [Chthoniobacterales bacterium]